MGALALACGKLASKVTRKIAVLATLEAPASPRAMSRVEQQASIRDVASIEVAPTSVRQAMPMTKPDIHPAELAAAMDRVETAPAPLSDIAPESVIVIASCDAEACKAPQVKGWSKVRKSKAQGKSVRHGAATSRKLAAAARKSGPAAAQPTFATIFGTTRKIRLAETPAEIIRRNLLGTS